MAGPSGDMKQMQVQQLYEEYAPKVIPNVKKVVEKKTKNVVEKPQPTTSSVEPVTSSQVSDAVVEIRQPDWGDHAYVWLRTKMSGELIIGIFIVGVLTIVTRKKVKEKIKSWLN